MTNQIIGYSIEITGDNSKYVIFLDITKEGAQTLLDIREGVKTTQSAPYLARHISLNTVTSIQSINTITGIQPGYIECADQKFFDLFDAGDAMNKVITDSDIMAEISDEAFYDASFYLHFEEEKFIVAATIYYNSHEASQLFFDISIEQLKKIAAGEDATQN